MRPCGIAALLAASCLDPFPASAQVANRAPEPVAEPILLQLVLDNQAVGDSLRAFPAGKSALVPLGELCHLLNFGITIQAGGRQASGFFIAERRRFTLDLEHGLVRVEGRTLPLPMAQVRALGGEIFVDAQLLETWFPMKATVNLKDASLVIVPREKLPIEMAWEHERALGEPGLAPGAAGPSYPMVRIPYAFLDCPMVDLNLSWEYTQHVGNPSPNGFLGLTGDALWMSNETVFGRVQSSPYQQETLDTNGNPENSLQTIPASQTFTGLERTTFFRQDPAGGLLGPLHARTVMLGDIIQAPMLNVAGTLSQGRGVLVDNHPTDFRTTFGHRRFEGSLPPGWYVELYQNGALLATARAGPDGRYVFPNVPMMFGLNIFKLVFHGPLGELREETRRMDISEDQPPPGTLYYQATQLKPTAADLASGLIAADAGTGSSYYTEAEYGLTKALALTGAMARVSRPPSIGDQEYREVGLRTVLPYLAIEQYGSQDQPLSGGPMGLAEQTLLRTGLGYSSLSLSHDEYRNGFLKTTGDGSGGSEGLLRSDSSLSLSQYFSLGSVPCSITLARTLEELIGQGTNIDDAVVFAANWPSWNLTNTLQRDQVAGTGDAPVPVQEDLAVTRSDATGTLQAEVGYSFLKGESGLTLWQVIRELQTSNGTTYRFGVSGSDTTLRNTSALASATRLLGRFSYSLAVQASTGSGYSVSLSLGTTLAREPRSGHWVADAQSMSTAGAVSAQAFLDSHGDGTRDPGAHVEDNVRYQVGGAELENRSTDPGTAFYLNAGSAQEQTVSLDPGSLESPDQAPETPGVRFVPRPGKVALLDFPVATLGEISSTTRVRRAGTTEPLGGVEVELVNAHGDQVKILRSSFDGYFEMTNIPLGDYTLRVTAREAVRLNLANRPSRKIHLDAKQSTQDGMDLILEGPAPEK